MNDITFKKGDNGWLGRKHTKESCRKMSEARKGRVITEEWKTKISQSHKGRRFTEEHKQNIADAGRGRKHSEETKKKLSQIARSRGAEWRKKLSESHKGHTPWIKGKKGVTIPWNKGKHLTESHKKKVSENHGMLGKAPWNKGKKGAPQLKGVASPYWKGGKHQSNSRHRNRRTQHGFVLITTKNPYNEPVEYHHIHPDLPYVVPCPTRIHQMFKDKATHFQNVNTMLGIVKINME